MCFPSGSNTYKFLFIISIDDITLFDTSPSAELSKYKLVNKREDESGLESYVLLKYPLFIKSELDNNLRSFIFSFLNFLKSTIIFIK